MRRDRRRSFATQARALYADKLAAGGIASGRTPDGSCARPAIRRRPILLPFYVNKLLEAKLGGFTSAEKIADGQYRFRVAGADRYVVWNGMPHGVSGSVVVTDMYGNESTIDASSVHPTEANPLIVTVPVSRRIRAVRR